MRKKERKDSERPKESCNPSHTWEDLYQSLQFRRKIERGETYRHVASNAVFDVEISNCMLDYGKELVQ